MASLKEDIRKGSDWVVVAFKALGIKLDYSIKSINDIEMFLDSQIDKGQPKEGGLLADNMGLKLFNIGAYVGETIIKNTEGSKWVTNDKDPGGEVNIAVVNEHGMEIWPVQKVLNRVTNGAEDNLYAYATVVIKKMGGPKAKGGFFGRFRK